jgi:hypothetical protein
MSVEFKITFDISDNVMKTRKCISMESTAPWYHLCYELAKNFNVHPDGLQAQYCLSSEKESAFPFGLNNEKDLQTLIDQLRPLSVPKSTKKGRSSAGKPPPVVNVFNNDPNVPNTGSNSTKAGKVWKL